MKFIDMSRGSSHTTRFMIDCSRKHTYMLWVCNIVYEEADLLAKLNGRRIVRKWFGL